MLVTFDTPQGGRVAVMPFEVASVKEDVIRHAGKEHKAAWIKMQDGDKHLVLDADRSAIDRLNWAMTPDEPEEVEGGE